jgi:hypothetical protein
MANFNTLISRKICKPEAKAILTVKYRFGVTQINFFQLSEANLAIMQTK